MPEYLTEEAMQQMLLRPMVKKGRTHPLRIVLANMKPNSIIYIKPEEFTWKGRSPKQFCNDISKTSKKVFSVYKDEVKKGWVVKREK